MMSSLNIPRGKEGGCVSIAWTGRHCALAVRVALLAAATGGRWDPRPGLGGPPAPGLSGPPPPQPPGPPLVP